MAEGKKSDRPPVSIHPPKAPPTRSQYTERKRTQSGQHPAVLAYREKLQSISDHQGVRMKDLDPELQALLYEADPFPSAPIVPQIDERAEPDDEPEPKTERNPKRTPQ